VDNLTHTLTAVAIGQAGLNRKTRFATLTVILGANLPDIDLVASFGGSATYLKYHRGITHSILGATVLALLLAWIVWTLGRKAKPKPGLPLAGRWLLLAAGLGTASHLLLDFTNSTECACFYLSARAGIRGTSCLFSILSCWRC